MSEETKKDAAQTTSASAEDAVENAEDGTNEENVNDAEFSDGTASEASEEKEKEQPKARQTKEQNAENARRRREAERRAQIARAEQAAREKAIIEALDGKNPYTGEEMKDADDVQEYLTMKEIKKNGGDPLTDFSRFQKSKEKKAREENEKKEQEKDWYKKDRENFAAKYPDVNVDDLISNEYFARFADGKVGRQPLSEIYEDFTDMVAEYEQRAERKAAQLLANAKASPGSLGGASGTETSFFTREQVKKMSQKEVHDNYDKIRESMKKWK